MIWLVWRQHRWQALFALVGLAALAAFMIPTGVQMHRAFERAGLPDCLSAAARVEWVTVQGPGPAPSAVSACRELAGEFANRYGSYNTVGVLLWFLPLLVGLFWGAPLVAREVEHGTHRFVWTQGVSRLRWALVKFGLVGGGVLLLAVGYALLVSWWKAPLDQVTGGFNPFVFDLDGIVPIGYTLFALALGVLAGVLTRRTLAAMAVTLVGFLAARLAVANLARPRFLTPLRRTFPVAGTTAPNDLTGDWVLTAGVYGADGSRLSGGAFGSYSRSVCGIPTGEGTDPAARCADEFAAGAYNLELFHPAGRYWLLQGIETALFVAFAVVLLLAAVHWVRRRLA